MRIVLTNLLGNAWKFCANRQKTVISFTAMPGDDGQIFCIRDNGAGFDMQYADKLFIPFQRLHLQEEFAGNGIGLATVNNIIRLHGGRIWAESEQDKGACFYFTLGTDKGTAGA
jgi:light-regulated signal transduction histidine kinase (bacteriophytochrome)